MGGRWPWAMFWIATSHTRWVNECDLIIRWQIQFNQITKKEAFIDFSMTRGHLKPEAYQWQRNDLLLQAGYSRLKRLMTFLHQSIYFLSLVLRIPAPTRIYQNSSLLQIVKPREDTKDFTRRSGAMMPSRRCKARYTVAMYSQIIVPLYMEPYAYEE